MKRMAAMIGVTAALSAGCGPRNQVQRPACVDLETGQECESCCQLDLEQCQKNKQGEFLDCLMEQDKCSEHAYGTSGAFTDSVMGEFTSGTPDLHCNWKKCSDDGPELCPRCVDESENCDIDLKVCLKLCQPPLD